MKLSQLELSIIFPAYNEEENIVETIQGAMSFLSSHKAEIIVVDDGSTDATLERLSPFQEKIKIIQHAHNQGYGAALRSGFTLREDSGFFFVTLIYSFLLMRSMIFGNISMSTI